uniref:Uncharacterized protein n=1 Tax=Trichogramma kaykai TaxID=54128 RepID=A0ABD2XJ39_9HYME
MSLRAKIEPCHYVKRTYIRSRLLHVPAAASPELISRSRKWTRRNNFLAGRVFSCTYTLLQIRETSSRSRSSSSSSSGT